MYSALRIQKENIRKISVFIVKVSHCVINFCSGQSRQLFSFIKFTWNNESLSPPSHARASHKLKHTPHSMVKIHKHTYVSKSITKVSCRKYFLWPQIIDYRYMWHNRENRVIGWLFLNMVFCVCLARLPQQTRHLTIHSYFMNVNYYRSIVAHILFTNRFVVSKAFHVIQN